MKSPSPSPSSGEADVDVLLFVGAYGKVFALDRGTGVTVWTTKLRRTGCGSLVTLLPILGQGVIVCASHGKVLALRMRDGVEVWRNSLPRLRFGNITATSTNGKFAAAAAAAAAASAAAAAVEEASADRSSESHHLDTRSPSLRGFLQYPSPGSSPPLSPQASTTGMLEDPVQLDGPMQRDLSSLAFIATSGGVRALDVRRGGETVWTYQLPGKGCPFMSILLAGGTLFVAGASSVVALDPVRGKATWQNDLFARIRVRVTLATATSAPSESSQPLISSDS